MKWNVGTKIGTGFGLALVILLAIGTVAYQSSVKLTDTADLVSHTHLLLQNLEGMLSSLKDAETGQRGFILTGEERYLEPYLAAQAATDQKIKTVRQLTSDNPNQQRRLDRLEPLIDGKDGKFAELQETIDLRKDKAKGFDAALQVVLSDKGKSVMDEIRKVVTEMEDEENKLLKERTEEAQANAHDAKLMIIFGTLFAFIVTSIAGFNITRNIAQPLQDLTGVAERITVGDLNVKISTNGRTDEVGKLARTFDRMTQSLRAVADTAGQIAVGDLRANVTPQSPQDVLGTAFARMIGNLREQIGGLAEGANVLGSAASEIVAATAQLAASSSESAAAVSETTTTVEEVRQTAQVASQKAKMVSDTAQKAMQISQGGRKAAEEAGTGMARIRQQMEAIAASMMQLSEQSQAIGQIIAVVEDLASQSTLLAVNAAIEAAKAGEQGKGFGVVAQEVKSLAEQSRAATTQVRTILGDIQKATTAAVLVTEQGNKAVEAGERQTSAAGDSIHALAGSVNEAAQAATQIAASSQQQLVGVDQVAGAMENIKQASVQNVASAKQLEVSARNLNDLGLRLKQMIERYKMSASDKA
jgi:methyl-accepting chemotaxis protein